MKARAFLVPVFTSLAALPGCFDQQSCPAGEVLVRDGASGDAICIPRAYSSGRSGSPTSATNVPSSPPSAAPALGATGGEAGAGGATVPTDSGSTGSAGAGACGGSAAQSDSVRVVGKSDGVPALGDSSSNLADGSYALVQATFYRSGVSTIPVRSLRGALDVHGPTLTVNARDTSVAGLPDESLTFLLASGGVLTKTCESVHGSVSAWFFPFSVGGATQAQIAHDGASSFVRLIVNRADGATELVFAR